MQGLALSPSQGPEHTTVAGSKLRVKQGGKAVPLSSALETKTRAIRNPLRFEAVAPQLWVSQTPNLVRAHHDREHVPGAAGGECGCADSEVGDESTVPLGEAGLADEDDHGAGEGVWRQVTVKYDVRGGKLVILRDEGRKMLPEDLYAKCDAGEPRAKAGGSVSRNTDAAPLAKQGGAGRDEKSSAIRRGESERDKTTVALPN